MIKILIINLIIKKFSFKNIIKIINIKKKSIKLKIINNIIIPNYIEIFNSYNNYSKTLFFNKNNNNYYLNIKSIQTNCIFGKILSSLKNSLLNKYYSLLERVLEIFFLKKLINKFKYQEINIPFFINYSNLLFSGQIPKFYSFLFKIEKKKIFLIPTSEVIINSLSFFFKKNFPIKIVCSSFCFRNEKKNNSKNNIGILRQNQFKKIEIFNFSLKNNSIITYYNMCCTIIYFLKLLKIKFKILKINNNEINNNAYCSIDFEIYDKNHNIWIEISSLTLCLNKPFNKYLKNKKIHLLNASCLPTGRLIYIISKIYRINNNYIKIPKILNKFLTDLLKW